jgi:hypothetical protein
MFNGNYDYAKVEMARRQEGLRKAELNGMAYQSRTRRPSFFGALRARLVGRVGVSAPTAVAPVAGTAEPCLDCP